jgi:pimeloyl-ACP methyl ester carboxylesterase
MLESWVRRLVQAGVPPSRITLIGFSRGGQITARAASGLRDLGINTAILAMCWKGDVVDFPSLVLGGRLFTIYETTDEMGSCEKLGRRGKLASFEEVSITTGRRHGAFFQPLPQWLTPLKAWISRTNH